MALIRASCAADTGRREAPDDLAVVVAPTVVGLAAAETAILLLLLAFGVVGLSDLDGDGRVFIFDAGEQQARWEVTIAGMVWLANEALATFKEAKGSLAERLQRLDGTKVRISDDLPPPVKAAIGRVVHEPDPLATASPLRTCIAIVEPECAGPTSGPIRLFVAPSGRSAAQTPHRRLR